jgi:hypothetical protein
VHPTGHGAQTQPFACENSYEDKIEACHGGFTEQVKSASYALMLCMYVTTYIHCPNRIFDRYDLVAPLDTTNIIIWARLNRCPKFRTGALSLPVTDMFQYIKKVASSQPVGMPPVRLLATEAAAVLRHPEQCIQSAGRAPLVKRGARETCRDVRHVLEATC